jgi:uncharacterized coiled-coil protein SlyX
MTAKGETIPQTVENLQAIMARDAETMMAMQAEIGELKARLNQAQQTIEKLRRGLRIVYQAIPASSDGLAG